MLGRRGGPEELLGEADFNSMCRSERRGGCVVTEDDIEAWK